MTRKGGINSEEGGGTYSEEIEIDAALNNTYIVLYINRINWHH